MRILYLTINEENRCFSTSWYFKNQLAKMENVVFYGPGHTKLPFIGRWDVSKIVDRVQTDGKIDVILIDHYWHLSSQYKNLDKIEIPKAFMVCDPHYEPKEKIRFIQQNKIDLALFIYKQSLSEYTAQGVNCHVEWLPWSIDTTVFKEYGFERKYDVTFLGTANKYYPLREKILKSLSQIPDINFFTQGPPGDWNLDPEKDLFRDNYAKVLAKSKIFIFDNSVWNYPVGKFFEAMACNALVLAPMPFEGKDLHFTPGLNFVEINEDDFLYKVKYYLKHDEERIEIARRGLETIEKYHTVQIRATQLIEYLKAIV
jgi:spore maturation protein CgeB